MYDSKNREQFSKIDRFSRQMLQHRLLEVPNSNQYLRGVAFRTEPSLIPAAPAPEAALAAVIAVESITAAPVAAAPVVVEAGLLEQPTGISDQHAAYLESLRQTVNDVHDHPEEPDAIAA
jgi:hypothetical protein